MLKESLPLISVITLTYKNFDFIHKTIDSILNQDYDNIQYIISDDGSENYPEDMINELLKNKSKNIKDLKIIRHENNMGIVKNLNAAINEASGEIIMQVASDDYLHDSKAISNIVSFFLYNPDALICTANRVLINEANNATGLSPTLNERKILNSDVKVQLQTLLNENFICGASTYYRRIVFDKIGLFDEDYIFLEDYPFYLKALDNGIKIYHLNYLTLRYRMGGLSFTWSNPKYYQDYNKILAYKGMLKAKYSI